MKSQGLIKVVTLILKGTWMCLPDLPSILSVIVDV